MSSRVGLWEAEAYGIILEKEKHKSKHELA